MNIRDRRAIHQAAKKSLASAQGDPKKILLIYLAIVTVLSLVTSGIEIALNHQIADTGGLGNLGLRSLLTTAQTVLPLLRLLVLIGLELGYCMAALRISRGESVSTDTLFQGFGRFFPLLGAMIIQCLLYFSVIFITLYASTYIFLMLPMSVEFYELMMPLMESVTALNSSITLDEATVMAAYDAMMPMLWIFGILLLLVFVPMHYRFRMVIYRLADQPRPRAIAAIFESRAMMYRNRFALLRLDLSLWWFYALQVLILLVSFGDSILHLAGITLPWSATANASLFFGLSLALQFVVYLNVMNPVAVTYATAYNALLPKDPHTEEKPAAPAVPWQDQY